MRVLVVGGTSFVGRAMAHEALSRGHQVSVINRGQTATDLPPTVERLRGDRSVDFASLRGRRFDATIDCTAYRPRDVDVLARDLGDRAGFVVHVSTISAYREPAAPHLTEGDLELHPDDPSLAEAPVTSATYGPLKAMTERRAVESFAGVAVVRPTYILGSHDATHRFPYWIARARRGGAIAIPGSTDVPLQYIDARDLATFSLDLARDGRPASVHVAAPDPATTYAAVVREAIARCGAPDATTRVVDGGRVDAAGLTARFPLWAGRRGAPILTLDTTAAQERGLRPRPLAETIDDTAAWWPLDGWSDAWLSAEDEARLIATDEGPGADE